MSDERDYGVIRLEDGNPPPADYTPARKASVEIGFHYQSATEAAGKAEAASALAEQQLNRLLGRTPRPTEAAQPAADKKPAAARSKKADPAPPASSEPSAGTAGTGGSEPDPFEVAPESPEVLAERARLADELAKGQVATDDEFTVQPAAEVASNDEFDVTTAPPKEITDADLNAAVQKKNGEINNSQAIRDLIGTFNPDPKRAFQLREIPQDKRAVFLERLGDLKKAA